MAGSSRWSAGQELPVWSYRRRWVLRAIGLVALAVGVLLLVSAVHERAPLTGAVFGLLSWFLQVVAWGWLLPAAGRKQLEARGSLSPDGRHPSGPSDS